MVSAKIPTSALFTLAPWASQQSKDFLLNAYYNCRGHFRRQGKHLPVHTGLVRHVFILQVGMYGSTFTILVTRSGLESTSAHLNWPLLR